MKSEIRYRPSFASIFLELEGQDHVIAEADAMASMSSNITLEPRPAGGFLNGLLRWFGGRESFFVNDFSVSDGTSGELVLTQNTPGDIACLDLEDGKEMYFQPGAFIACTPEIKLGTGFAGF
ncbi:MAG: AIM24 family protein [Planctomycetota bacterium]